MEEMNAGVESWLERLEALLEPLSRLIQNLERDLVSVERVRPVHLVRQPASDRLQDSIERGTSLLPIHHHVGRAHILTAWGHQALLEGGRSDGKAVLGFRIMEMVDRETVSSLDTAPNRVLAQSLHRATRCMDRWIRRGGLDAGLCERLRSRRRDLRALQYRGFGEEGPGLMRPHDLLHRSLRARRYLVAKKLWDLLREVPSGSSNGR